MTTTVHPPATRPMGSIWARTMRLQRQVQIRPSGAIWSSGTPGTACTGTAQLTGFFIDQNVVYDNGVTGLDFEEGLSNSFYPQQCRIQQRETTPSLINYPGNCPTQAGYDSSSLLCCSVLPIRITTLSRTTRSSPRAMPICRNLQEANPDAGCPCTGVLYCAQPPIQIS